LTYSIELKGADELFRKLTELSAEDAKLPKRIVKRALRAGARPILQAVKAAVPVKSGELRRAIKVRAAKGRRGEVRVRIGTYAAGSDNHVPGYYAPMIEAGTKERHTASGANRGRIEATHFEANAFDETAESAIELIMQAIGDGIEAVWAK
jgi:HK97 gp10 family phage protein